MKNNIYVKYANIKSMFLDIQVNPVHSKAVIKMVIVGTGSQGQRVE